MPTCVALSHASRDADQPMIRSFLHHNIPTPIRVATLIGVQIVVVFIVAIKESNILVNDDAGKQSE